MNATVSGLFVYPVKSCGGIRVEQSLLEPRGFRHDRRWMVIDETKTFVTQRTAPRLALITTSLEEEALLLEAPGLPALCVPLIDAACPSSAHALVSVRVWRDDVLAVDCGKQASSWLTGWLGTPASLVFMPAESRRPVNPAYAVDGDIVSFADGYPVLIASTSSLDELNAQMPEGVPMDRFRPNIVVSGAPPWSEDSWARVLIGRIRFGCPSHANGAWSRRSISAPANAGPSRCARWPSRASKATPFSSRKTPWARRRESSPRVTR